MPAFIDFYPASIMLVVIQSFVNLRFSRVIGKVANHSKGGMIICIQKISPFPPPKTLSFSPINGLMKNIKGLV